MEQHNESFSELDLNVDYDILNRTMHLDTLQLAIPTNQNGALLSPVLTTLSTEENGFGAEYKYSDFRWIFPPTEPGDVCNTEYAGPLSFEAFVDPNGMKNYWEYSPVLQKMYIDMKHKFPVNFSVKNQASDTNLFIRVLPVFAEDRHFQDLVHRCMGHAMSEDPINNGITEAMKHHIIRCDNESARYFGDKNSRLNIVLPLGNPQAGTDSVKEFFYFVCKNSCSPNGMNRRPIQIIFTLENESGTVLGRRVLSVRICSCPKRDREKEERKKDILESHSSKKRKIEKKTPAALPPPTAVPQNDASDDAHKIYTLQLKVPGKQNYKQILKTARMLMSDEIMDKKSENVEDLQKCKDDVNILLSQVAD